MAFSCKRCGEELSTKQALVRHLQKTNSCPLLPNVLDISRETYILQLTTKNYNDITYSCRHCNVKFNTQSSMYRHMNVCKKRPVSKSGIPATTLSVNQSFPHLKNEVDQLRQTVETVQTLQSALTTELQQKSNTIDNLKLEIAFLKNKKNEQFYQEIMEKHFNAAHKTLNIGITDIHSSM